MSGLLATIGSVLLIVFVTFLFGLLLVGPSLALFAKGTRVIDAARANLRALDDLPKATLREP